MNQYNTKGAHMDRTEYIELCKRCATLPERNGRKNNVPDELKVEHNGICYYPLSYTLSYDAMGKIIHSCTLHSLDAKSVTVCDLGKVKPYKDAAR